MRFFSVDLIRTPAVVEFREMSAKIFHDSLKNQTKNFKNIIYNTFFINSLFFLFGGMEPSGEATISNLGG